MDYDLKEQAPIIICGMHRSGTSLVARMLQVLGLNIGNCLDQNYEDVFFQYLNRLILNSLGYRWDYPGDVDSVISTTDCQTSYGTLLERILRSPPLICFRGPKLWLAFRRNYTASAWGWKDPRNIITLPIWLSVFPRAKIIWVYRNGTDVASSLVRRTQNFHIRELAYAMNAKPLPFLLRSLYSTNEGVSGRTKDLVQAFGLWEEYLSIGDRRLAAVASDRILKVRYESLILSPEDELPQITKFAGIECTTEDLRKVTSISESSRAFAYHDDDELNKFHESIKGRESMRKYGYG